MSISAKIWKQFFFLGAELCTYSMSVQTDRRRQTKNFLIVHLTIFFCTPANLTMNLMAFIQKL